MDKELFSVSNQRLFFIFEFQYGNEHSRDTIRSTYLSK